MKRLLFLSLVAITCCTTEKKAAETQVPSGITVMDSTFARYLDLLPQVTLPYETNCGQCCTHPSIDEENELVRKFTPEGAHLVGVISRTDSSAVTLVTYAADLIIPSVNVYNAKGELTGKENFMTRYCGGEPGFYSTQFFRINKNLSMIQIDTVYEMTYDSVTYNTIDTTDIEITRRNFRIDGRGEIVEGN